MSAGIPPLNVDLAREADLRLGALEVRPSRREIVSGEGRSVLEPRVMQVLVALARRLGEVVSRDELIARCWDGRIVGDDAINACVAKVRRVGEAAGAYVIETIPRVGYRLTAVPDAASPAAPEVLLAVLPFENLSGDPDLGYFSDGISEEILNALAQRADLKVIGRSSSFQFRGADKAIPNLIRQLGATHVLDGSVRRSGQRTRVFAQLIDCATQTAVWADRVERDLSDIFDLQDQIAVAVAQAMRTALAPAVRSGMVDPEAYDLFLRGSVRPDRMTADALRRQVTQLKEAVRRAPNFADAWAGLGYVQAALAGFAVGGEARAVATAARESAQHALSIDPRCALAAVALARTEPRYGAAWIRERWLRQAVEWESGSTLAHRDYARLLAAVGRGREALVQVQHAHRLDPLHIDTYAMLGRTLAENGEVTEARRVLEAGMTRWPDFELFPIWLTVVLSATGDVEAARRLRERLPDDAIGQGIAVVPELYAGDEPAVDTFLAGVRRAFEQTGRITISAMCLMADVGYADEALTRALAPRHEGSQPSAAPPFANSAFNTAQLFARFQPAIRRDVRFVTVCARFRLVEYWLSAGVWPDCVEEVAPYYDFKAECRRVAAVSASAPPGAPQ